MLILLPGRDGIVTAPSSRQVYLATQIVCPASEEAGAFSLVVRVELHGREANDIALTDRWGEREVCRSDVTLQPEQHTLRE